MEEFTIAHQKVVEGHKNFIIVVLVEDIDIDTLPDEMQSYLRTYTYIDARNYEQDLEKIRKTIRYSMPGTPLEKIRQMQREAAAEREDSEHTDIEVIEEVSREKDDEDGDDKASGEDTDEVSTEEETNHENTMFGIESSSNDSSLLSVEVYEMHEVHTETYTREFKVMT